MKIMLTIPYSPPIRNPKRYLKRSENGLTFNTSIKPMVIIGVIRVNRMKYDIILILDLNFSSPSMELN
jgi:hypothetical protein